jgi:hypothetical protein
MSTPFTQIRGAANLASDVFDATVDAVSTTHRQVVQLAFAPLGMIKPLAGPVKTVEDLQMSIADGAFQVAHSVNRAVNNSATALLDQVEARVQA